MTGRAGWPMAGPLAALATVAGLVASAVAGCQPSAARVWRVVHVFGPVGGQSDVYSMSAVSASDVWATGYRCSRACRRAGGRGTVVLVQHWDGRSWHAVRAPAGLAWKPEGISVSALSADDAWIAAAGHRGPGPRAASVPYVLHWGSRLLGVRVVAVGMNRVDLVR